MVKMEQSKIGNAVAALEQIAGGVGPIKSIDLDLAAAVALVGTAGF